MASGTVTVNIIGDANSLKRALGESESALGSFQSKLSSFGGKMQSAGVKMSLGITAPLALLGKAAFNAASDLNESMNKVDVVFGNNAGVIKKWSQDAATAMGISRQEALEAAGTFGNLFRALDVGKKPATEMSQKLVGLASDLASFNNADPTEVLTSLRSGLVGEVEPLRKFGVSLSEARVEAKALELGLASNKAEISDSDKVMARYAIILDDTKTAQGDFARTADGAANKQRTLNAEWKDTEAKLGTALLPIFQKLAGVLSEVAGWFSGLSAGTQEVIVYAGLALAALGPLTTIVGTLAKVTSGAITVVQNLATASETLALKSMYAKDWIAQNATAITGWGLVAGLAIGTAVGLSQAFGDQTVKLQANIAELRELTEAQLVHFIQKAAEAGDKLQTNNLVHSAFLSILQQDTVQAQVFIDTLKGMGQNTDWYDGKLKKHIATQQQANAEHDAAKQKVDALGQSVNNLPPGKFIPITADTAQALSDIGQLQSAIDNLPFFREIGIRIVGDTGSDTFSLNPNASDRNVKYNIVPVT